MDKVIDNLKTRIKERNFLITIIGLGAIILGVFLPFYKISFFGLSTSINFIYNEGELCVGAWVLIGALVGFGLLCYDKDKFSLIPIGIAFLVYGKEYLDYLDKLKGTGTTLGLGFYLILLGFIAAVTGIILNIKDEDENGKTNKPKVVDAKFESVVAKAVDTKIESVENKKINKVKNGGNAFCSNCGAKKESDDSVFCTSCGTKF